ncbi:hypothetical protein ACTL6U_20200 [Rhodovibrionaceae bacterium A322]
MKLARNPFLFLCLSLFLSLASYGTSAQTKDSLTWFIWDLPPEFVSSGPYKDQGYADKFLKFFVDRLPGYDHKVQRVNIPRWSQEALKPQRCSVHLWGGFFPDQLLLSKPYSFTPPQVAIFPKRHQARIGPPGTVVSLADLLSQDDLTLAIVPLFLNKEAGQSRYPVLYPFLAPYRDQKNFIEVNSIENIINLKFLQPNRADYTLGYPSTITTQMRVNGLTGDFIYYHLKEHQLYKKVYVACNNSAFGRRVIDQVNALLTPQTLLTFLDYHEEWNDGDPAFRETTLDFFIRHLPLENVIN